MVHAIRVEKKRANEILKKLLKRGLVEDQWKIVEDGDYLIIPVKKEMDGSFEFSFMPRERKLKPYEKIVELARRRSIKCDLPDYWEKIGKVILIREFKCDENELGEIGKIYAEVLHGKTVCIYGGIEGELRRQRVRVIFGRDTETVHVENGIKYKLDVAKIMFSSGNVNERISMGKIDAKDEIVVDMFAGIGYFTLPIAVYGNPKKVYACEKNPVAYYYLLENIRLNGVNNVIPLFGDNRNVCPLGLADRVIMGYIRTWDFLPLGFKILKEKGVIHYHDTFREEEIPDIEEKLVDYAERVGYNIEIPSKRIVKSYAPRIWHLAFDILVKGKI